MDDEIADIIARLRLRTAEADVDGVEDTTREFEMIISEEGHWPDPIFQAVTSFLLDETFLAIRSSSQMVSQLEMGWDELSTQQRAALRPALEQAFDRFADWMGAFRTANMLGRFYADEEAFKALEALSNGAKTITSKALATYGLGELARTVRSGSLHERAVLRLKALSESEITDIRKEALLALQRLSQPAD